MTFGENLGLQSIYKAYEEQKIPLKGKCLKKRTKKISKENEALV